MNVLISSTCIALYMLYSDETVTQRNHCLLLELVRLLLSFDLSKIELFELVFCKMFLGSLKNVSNEHM